jgi:O-antigen/teichoic acid export membrane protein
MSAYRPSVLGNTSTSIVRFLIGVVATFLLTPYIIEHIGKADYGLWSLVFSILGFIGLVDMGFATSTVKYVAETRGQGDPDRRNRLVSTLFVVYMILALAVAVASALLATWFNDLFDIPPEQHRDALLVFAILAVRLALYLPLGLFRGVLFGEQRIVWINAVQVAAALLNVGLTVAVLEAGFGVVALAVTNVVVLVAEHAVYVALTRRALPDLVLRPRFFTRAHLRELLGFSVFAALVNVSSVVVLQADPIIIKMFLPLGAVAVYAVALRIATYVLLLVKQLNNVITPVIAERHGAGDHERLRVIFVRATKFTLALALPLALGLGLHADALMLHWLGPDFVEAGPLLVVLLAAMTLMLARETSSNYLALTGRHRYTGGMALAAAALNLAASALFAWFWGLIGVALGTLAAALFVDVGVVIPRACRTIGIPLVSYVRRAVLPTAAPTVATAAVLVTLRLAWPPGSLLALGAQLGLAGLVFAGVFWLVALDREERETATALLARRRSDAGA